RGRRRAPAAQTTAVRQPTPVPQATLVPQSPAARTVPGTPTGPVPPAGPPLGPGYRPEPPVPSPDRRRFLVTGSAVAGAAVVAGLISRELTADHSVDQVRSALRVPRPDRPAPPLAPGPGLRPPGPRPVLAPD